MSAKKSNNRFEKRLMERLDRLDPNMLQGHLQGLIQEKGFLEDVFNTIHEAVIVVDDSLDICYFNRASQTLLGLNEMASGEYIGKYLKQLNWVDLLKGGENGDRWWGVSRREMEVFYPEHRYLDFTIMPVMSDGGASRKGRRPYATLIFNDNTETMQANERQVETQKVKAITQLAAGVAHELGNPLNSLGIHLQLLKRALRKLPEGDMQENAMKHIDVAVQEVGRLDCIVKNFLDAVRPKPPKMEPLDLEKLLKDALEFMRTEIENKKISVEARVPVGIPMLLGDADQLTQAAYNLIKNAIQAMSEGGRLMIDVVVDDVHVHVRFADTGPGISETDLQRLMEPYYTTKSSGTGLGLLIVDRIVRAHGGELSIESRVGEGAAFTISLPRHARMVRQLEAGSPAGKE